MIQAQVKLPLLVAMQMFFYAGLDEDDIESAGRLILIVQELMSLNRFRESEKRLLKK